MSEPRTSLENEVILATSVLYLLIVGVMVLAHAVAVLMAESPEATAAADRHSASKPAEAAGP